MKAPKRFTYSDIRETNEIAQCITNRAVSKDQSGNNPNIRSGAEALEPKSSTTTRTLLCQELPNTPASAHFIRDPDLSEKMILSG